MRKKSEADDGTKPEYDFAEGVRGKYAERYAEGRTVVTLDPDVAAEFKSSEEVNRALRELIRKREA